MRSGFPLHMVVTLLGFVLYDDGLQEVQLITLKGGLSTVVTWDTHAPLHPNIDTTADSHPGNVTVILTLSLMHTGCGGSLLSQLVDGRVTRLISRTKSKSCSNL